MRVYKCGKVGKIMSNCEDRRSVNLKKKQKKEKRKTTCFDPNCLHATFLLVRFREWFLDFVLLRHRFSVSLTSYLFMVPFVGATVFFLQMVERIHTARANFRSLCWDSAEWQERRGFPDHECSHTKCSWNDVYLQGSRNFGGELLSAQV